MSVVHITRINETLANIQTNLDPGQTAIATDAGSANARTQYHLWEESGGSYQYCPGVQWVWSSGGGYEYQSNDFYDVTARHDIYVANALYVYGDTDTKWVFSADRVQQYVGNVRMLDITEGATDYFEVNPDNSDVNTIINGTASDLLFCDAGNNRVGIGTATPAAMLEISGESSPQIYVTDTTNSCRAYMQSTDTAGIFGTTSAHNVIFGTNATERIRILSTGNVGINATNPAAMLEVSSASSPDVYVTDTTNGCRVYLQATDNLAYIGTYSAHNLAIASNATERIRILSTGNVGIGTTNPAAMLEISGESSPQIYVTDTTNSCRAYMQSTDTAGSFGTTSAHNVIFGTNSTERARILSTGQFGIGTTAPDRLLHAEVSDAGTNAVVYALRLSHISSSAPTDNFGTGIEFELENDQYSDNFVATAIDSVWLDENAVQGGFVISTRLGNASLVKNFTFYTVDDTVETTCLRMHNYEHSDSDDYRRSRIEAYGEQSGGEASVLGWLSFSHDGIADDQKGMVSFYCNDGSDDTTPTLAARLRLHGLAVGADASAWAAGIDYVQIGGVSTMATSGSDDLILYANAYTDGTEKYVTDGYATCIYQVGDGSILFRSAGSGSANGTISWAHFLEMDTNGYFGLDKTTPASKIHAYELTATYDAVLTMLTLETASSGSVDAGYGVGIDFIAEGYSTYSGQLTLGYHDMEWVFTGCSVHKFGYLIDGAAQDIFTLGANEGIFGMVLYNATSTAAYATFDVDSSGYLVLDATGDRIKITSGDELQLGQAYAAGSVSCDGTISIRDSSGTEYHLMVSTSAA